MTNPVLECRNVVREFSEGLTTLQVLRGVNLAVQPAERVAIIGASGSGKTTLLQIMGGLDDPSEGGVLVNGAAMHGTTETAKGELRNRYIGFIYQFHHLLPDWVNACIISQGSCRVANVSGRPWQGLSLRVRS